VLVYFNTEIEFNFNTFPGNSSNRKLADQQQKFDLELFKSCPRKNQKILLNSKAT